MLSITLLPSAPYPQPVCCIGGTGTRHNVAKTYTLVWLTVNMARHTKLRCLWMMDVLGERDMRMLLGTGERFRPP